MSEQSTRTPVVPRWLHAWAILTACAALPLVTLGAEVTTKQVGMADTVGFRAPWYFFTLDLSQTSVGLLIEHSHRLAGFAVGICCIVLALGLSFVGGRTPTQRVPYRWLGWGALLAVSLQGVLGIFRVNLHALVGDSLKTLHACFAQLVFSYLVALAILTSRAFGRRASVLACPSGASEDACPTGRVRLVAVLLAIVTYVQVVFGAVMRHLFNPAAQRLHILLAFVVVGLFVWLARELREQPPDRALRRVGLVLMVLLFFQPMLGLEAWIRRFGSGELPELVRPSPMLDTVRSGHHVFGTLIFAATVALSILVWRRLEQPAGSAVAGRVASREGAASPGVEEVVGSAGGTR
jgi:heme A synthase